MQTESARRPVVVCLHGFLGSARDWDDLPAALPDADCLALELPGHGAGGAADESACDIPGAAARVIARLDAAGVARAALIGYSMGGRVALHLAVHHPARWRALVVESASPGLEDAAARAARAAADEAWARKLAERPLREFLDDWYGQPLFASLRQRPEILRALLARREAGDPAGLARALHGMSVGRQEPLWPRLADLRVPALFIAGALDPAYVALSARMQRLCRDGRRAIVPGAGHNVHAEQPVVYGRAVRAFLDGVGPERGRAPA